MGHKEIEIIGAENMTIRGNAWTTNDKPKKSVVIIHGMSEYSFRYNDFAKFLNKKGYDVFALDHIGHGLTVNDKKELGVWPENGFELCVENVHILVKKLQEEGREVYIFSHSMGSFMGQSYLQRYPGEVKKIVLCGTGGPSPIVKAGALMAKMIYKIKKHGEEQEPTLNKLAFGSYNKKVPVKRTAFDWLSVNEENVDKYIADDYCGYLHSRAFFYSFIGNLAKLHTKVGLAKIDKETKIYLIAGKEDPVGDYTKTIDKLEKLYKKQGLDVKKKYYDNMRHEILNEDGKAEVYDDVASFYKE